jgi:RND family efflux transporter MFP subunit
LPFFADGLPLKKSLAAETAPVAVKLKTVELSTPNRGVRYSANIEPQKQIELAFKVSGYVDRLMQARGVDGRLRDVQAGDRVAHGAELARVQPNEYAVKVKQAEAQTAEAKSSLDSGKAQLAEAHSSVASGKAQLAEAATAREKARLDFERAKTLFASQSMTKTDYDAARAQFDAAEAKHAAAQSQVAMLEAKTSVANAQIEMLNARINSAEARIIADLSSVKAVFGVPDLTVGKLKLGSTLMVTTESLPGHEFQGQITSIAPAADPKSRVFEIEVTIRNPQQLLKSGMIASLEVAAATQAPPVTVVPVSAVVRARNNAEQYAVFVVDERGGKQIARVRLVKLGEALGNTIVVLEGVSAGERIITTGATQALDGQVVQVIP